MNTFHSRQTDCDRHARKNENTGTLNFTSQIAPSICTVRHTKRVKNSATNFKSRCSRTVVCYRLDRVQALPLVTTRFLRLAHISPMVARSPARQSRDVRETSGKKSGEMSRATAARCPGNGRTQWQQQCRRASVKRTRKTTRPAPDLDTPCPRRKLARQLATWARNGQCNLSQAVRRILTASFNQGIQQL
jgi:hypothetical protein